MTSAFIRLDSSSRGTPPCIGTTKIFDVFPFWIPVKAISFPFGDHLGRAARIGGNVNCSLSVPSTRLRHKAKSGYETYVTQTPSGE
jgi:hypothetical protein